MKKIITLIICSILLLSFFNLYSIKAEETTSTTESTTTTTTNPPESTPTTSTPPPPTTLPLFPIKPLFKGISAEDLKQSLSIQEKIGWRLGQTQNVSKNNTIIHIKAAKLTEIVSNQMIKIEIFGYNYKVDLGNANLYRQGWGKSELDEFSVGDVINVYGYLDENDNFLIRAINVRDMSILLTHYVFKGVIKSIDSENKTFVLNTSSHGDLTVGIYADTKIIKFSTNTTPFYTEGEFKDLKTGEPAIVRGVYNINQKKIDAQLVIMGIDERPFFKNIVRLKEQIKTQEHFLNQGEYIRNSIRQQIENLQRLFEQYREQLRKRGQ